MTQDRGYWIWTSKAALTDFLDPAAPKRTGSRSGPGSWWSCAKGTKAGDIAFVYRTESGRTDEDPQTGVRLVIEVLGDPIDLSREPYAKDQGWSWGCRFQVLAALKRPVAIGELRDLGIVGTGSVGVLRAANSLSAEHGKALLAHIAKHGQKVRVPDRPEIDGEYRRELDLQAEILASANLPVVLHNLGIRPPEPIRLIGDGDVVANVRAEMRVNDDGRRRRADIVVDEPGLLGRRVIIELKNTPATLPHLEQVIAYRHKIDRTGLRRPAAILVATTIPDKVRNAAKKARVQVATIDELGLPSPTGGRA